jgi:alkylation response protein AidB-like acyl-CoA dehydrogenase
VRSDGHALAGLEPGAEAFRRKVCAWLREYMAAERVATHVQPTDRTGLNAAFERELHRAAGERGYLGISLPAAVGGGGMPPSYAAALHYETTYHDAPLVDTAVVLAAAPVSAFGGDQPAHRELLALMLRGEVTMCIGYTEAAAGNDLSALTTVAEPQPGGGFRLSGSKTLITAADKADACLTIARSEPDVPIRRGASMFVVDMNAPGVSVHPQRTIAGYDLWNIHFDNVDLPPHALLGERGQGWRQLAYAVEQERGGMFTLGWCQRLWDQLAEYATAGSPGTRPVDDPVVAMRLGRLWARLQVGRRHALRLLAEETAGERSAASASAAKVTLTETIQRLARYSTELAGPAGALVRGPFEPAIDVPGGGRFGYEYLFRFDGTVSVGASELHRTGIAAALGVHAPRDGQPPPTFPDLSVAVVNDDLRPLAELAGHLAALLAITVSRVTSRAAYGSTLAALAPVQQRVADMWLDVVAVRDAIREAGEPAASSPASISEARLTTVDAAARVIAGAHQLCGGWGYLEEAGLGLHTRAVTMLEGQLGPPDELAAALGTLLLR